MGKTILTPNQHRLLEYAAKSPTVAEHFYLTGGTALAEFYLQHRVSEDLDFFTKDPIIEVEILQWVQKSAHTLHVDEVEHQTLRGQEIFFFHFPKWEHSQK